MQSSLSPTFSEISSPLNSARSTQSARAAARRVGLETYGSHILQAKRHALVALANKEAQDEMNVMTELDRFDDRLDQTLNVRPQLAVSARISLPLQLPTSAEEDDVSQSGSTHTRRPPPPHTAAQVRALANAAIAQAFALIDSDGNGVISRSEVLDAVHSSAEVRRVLGMPGVSGTDAVGHVRALFQTGEDDDSTSITLDEFAKAFRPRASS